MADTLIGIQPKIREKLANLQKIIILTQAEYDALPETKNTDGIVYMIKE
ncbi:hypothetical protein [Pseudobacteroides cellulosolvens]|uniref:Uncharacterized protein n=1 Tax=Pseudobacteroides cellulosolvens ATCC 35603 = DSM 2933 TaxID=398512 RepID=A0A0L6JKU5_9FIRM|nr:hypothetical protein [Pseudobacteroides cellulosolvens]KNY26333.1 hypothetical protein Bccel_1595 [Pseudobacteroides cellulosolvens ATCC 35603 = DSM 2933]